MAENYGVLVRKHPTLTRIGCNFIFGNSYSYKWYERDYTVCMRNYGRRLDHIYLPIL